MLILLLAAHSVVQLGGPSTLPVAQQRLIALATRRVHEAGERWLSCGLKASVSATQRGDRAPPRQLAQRSVDSCVSFRKELELVARSSAQSLVPGRDVEPGVKQIVAYERQRIIAGLSRTIETANAKMRR